MMKKVFTLFMLLVLSSSLFSQVLPVTLTKFTVKRTASEKVLVQWSTESEVNSSHFRVEKSFDGTDFQLVKSVNSVGKGSDYQIEDVSNPYQDVYYRLKQVDRDDKTEVFKIATLEGIRKIDSKTPLVTPNPSTGSITINSGDYKVQIYNILGRLVSTTSNGDELELPKGVYLAKVVGLDLFKKFTVQ